MLLLTPRRSAAEWITICAEDASTAAQSNVAIARANRVTRQVIVVRLRIGNSILASPRAHQERLATHGDGDPPPTKANTQRPPATGPVERDASYAMATTRNLGAPRVILRSSKTRTGKRRVSCRVLVSLIRAESKVC